MRSISPLISIWIAAVLIAPSFAFALGEGDSPESAHPGHLVDSASTNTSMRIPNWDLEAHKSSVPPESEAKSDAGNVDGDAAGATKAQAAGHEEPEAQVNSLDQSLEISVETNTTTIPRPVVTQARSQGGDVVPRATPTQAAWYRHPLAALVVVFGAIAAIAWVFRKYVPASRMIPMSAVRVVGRAPISAKHSIALLHIGQRLLLVGMTADRVSTLSEITDPQEVSLLLGSTGDAAIESAFGQQLTEQLDGFDAEPVGAGVDDRSLLDETKGQLQSLMKKLRSLRAA